MSKSDIEWTEEVWNVVAGCKATSPGCANCYAVPLSHKLAANPATPQYKGLTVLRKGGGVRFAGIFREIPDRLAIPLHKRSPTTWFVNSMSDLFGEGVLDEFIAAAFGVMAATPRHTYQVLTKRAERLPAWMEWIAEQGSQLVDDVGESPGPGTSADGIACVMLYNNTRDLSDWLPASAYNAAPWPLPNVWLGVSVEDKKHGLPRIEHLRRTPAAVRFLSIEPLLEDLGEIDLTGIQWVIVGGESGHNARPMHPDWVRSIRDQCGNAGAKFFFKQWGEWVTEEQAPDEIVLPSTAHTFGGSVGYFKVGKKAAGRMLDGRTWDEMPARVL